MSTAIIEERLAALNTLTLRKGGGSDPEHACVMQATAWIAGEPWSDHPECVSPVLGAFLRAWNDSLDDDGRQRLKAYVPRLIGTAGDGQDEARAWLATDWLVRVCAPAWLELAGVNESCAALRALPPITVETCKASQPTVLEARKAGAAAGAAAWAAAGAAAWAALEPTRVELQASAHELLERIIDPAGSAA